MNATQNKLGWLMYVLLFLVTLRFLGTGLSGVLNFQAGVNQNIYVGIISLSLALLYAIGFVGILKKKKFAIGVLIFLAVVDLLSAFNIGGAYGLGAGVYDIVVGYLAYREYKKLGLEPESSAV